MTILSSLQEIMDLKDPWDEAKKKLTGTWMWCDGTIQYIRAFLDNTHISTIDTVTNEGKNLLVKDLKVWLPETGIYPFANGDWIYLQKLPKRQWLRSFSESFYEIQLKETKQKLKKDSKYYIKELANSKKVDIYVTPEKLIYWRNICIGHIKNEEELVCTNTHFSQELIDWSKNT